MFKIQKSTVTTFLKSFTILLILLVLFTAFSYLYIKSGYVNSVVDFLNERGSRIENDLDYKNGKWDTTKYNSDPLTPYPNTSSDYPLYIITTDGYVIERSSPISGYLDTSDFKHLIQFSSPVTFDAATNENWRVLSSPIINNGQRTGVVFVARYNPEPSILDKVDKELNDNVQGIKAQLSSKENEVDASKLDVRNLHFSISFEIVDRYNRVVSNNGRTPSYIDASYVSSEMQKPELHYVTDQKTNEDYIVLRKNILDENNTVVGIIVIAKSIGSTAIILNQYVTFSLVLGVFFTAIISILVTFYLTKSNGSGKAQGNDFVKEKPKMIRFDKSESYIEIDGNRVTIPYASNQYMILKSLFTSPNKRWEQDELLEKLGEDALGGNNRKIYDAMLAINKKVEVPLITYKDKTYRINPDYISIIK